eukprot:720358-Rhodomonas_salina.2
MYPGGEVMKSGSDATLSRRFSDVAAGLSIATGSTVYVPPTAMLMGGEAWAVCGFITEKRKV